MNKIYIILILIVSSSCLQSQNQSSQWRGPDRKGIFHETELLKQWPGNGPDLLWSIENLGDGHSSPGIGNNKVFINGMRDTIGVLFCYDLDGSLLWEKPYGEEWHVNFVGTRSTPLVQDEYVYLESGMGKVCCFNESTGEIIWSENFIETYEALDVKWGLTESLLIDGNNLICTPGGERHNVIALDRFTGELVWSCEGFKEQSAYCSPILVERGNTSLVVTLTSTSVIGIDADSGELYWRVEQNQRNKIHANSPVYENGIIYCSSSSDKTNSGLLALCLSEDGKSVKQFWRNETNTNLMGGIVIKDGFIFGSKYRSNIWYAVDCNTGEQNILTEDFKNGVIVYANGLFYCYNENGEVALVEMTPESFEIKGKFDVPLGENQHWAHPVIHNKRMYIRHGSALMVYDISAKS